MAIACVTGGTAVAVSASETEVQLLPASAGRAFYTIFNNSAAHLFVRFGADSPTWGLKMPPQSFYEAPSPVFRGAIYGRWTNADGDARVAEFF